MNPWTALLQPLQSRPGDPTPKAPRAQRPAQPRKPVAAAALVVTHETGDARLLPIIAIDFAQDRNYWR
jgi:hypothetical protein